MAAHGYGRVAEEETPDLRASALQCRLTRGLEHWRGNTHLTLTALVLRGVEPATGQRVVVDDVEHE